MKGTFLCFSILTHRIYFFHFLPRVVLSDSVPFLTPKEHKFWHYFLLETSKRRGKYRPTSGISAFAFSSFALSLIMSKPIKGPTLHYHLNMVFNPPSCLIRFFFWVIVVEKYFYKFFFYYYFLIFKSS
jgi:hypothetical protein